MDGDNPDCPNQWGVGVGSRFIVDPWLTGPHLPGAQTTIDGFDAAVAGDQLTYKAMGYEAFTVHAPTVEVGIGSVDTSDDVVELTQQVTAGVGGGFEA